MLTLKLEDDVTVRLPMTTLALPTRSPDGVASMTRLRDVSIRTLSPAGETSVSVAEIPLALVTAPARGMVFMWWRGGGKITALMPEVLRCGQYPGKWPQPRRRNPEAPERVSDEAEPGRDRESQQRRGDIESRGTKPQLFDSQSPGQMETGDPGGNRRRE